jgi:hypothetical protein
MKILRLLALALAMLVSTQAASHAEDIKIGDLVIRQVWSRATIGSGVNGAIYLEIDNTGASDDRLVAIASPVAAMAHLHMTEMQGDMASMKAMDGLDIPAGAKVVLKPQANHIMLMGLSQQLKQGADFPLTLQFEKAGKVEVKAVVEAAGALAPSGN